MLPLKSSSLKEEVSRSGLDCYAFGMRMGGLSSPISGTENRYRYNGKELHTELNLNWYDYGARMYDPSIGRWNGVDALADSSVNFSPYNYTVNSPLLVLDPDGRDTLIMHLNLNTRLSNDYFNVFNVSFSLVIDNEEFIIELGPEWDIYSFSNKESDTKGENALNRDKFYGLRFQMMETHRQRAEQSPSYLDMYKNEIMITGIDRNGKPRRIGRRGAFFHYGFHFRHFDGCKGLCTEIVFKEDGEIITYDGSVKTALNKVKDVYDQVADQLTGQKFLLEPNSSVRSPLSKHDDNNVRSYNRFLGLFNGKHRVLPRLSN